MKLRYVFFFGVFSFMGLGLISSCKDFKSRKTSAIVFDSVVVNQKIPLLLENDSTLPFADVSISYTYPVKYVNDSKLLRLQQIIQGTFFDNIEYDSMTPQEAMDYYLETYIERYKSISNMYYEEKARLDGKIPAWYWYFMKHTNTFLFQSDSLISYAVEYSDYEGGAHGSYRITYTNIDLNNLVTISEEDLFVPDYYKQLTDKILKQIMLKYESDVPDTLLMRGFFNIEDIAPNNNFWLNDEGIHYSYNQYEIAPYSMGVIDVTIPYTELYDILIPNGIIHRYLLDK